MESFHWDTHFETGLDEVDSQHKQLVALINALAEHTAGQGATGLDPAGLFTQLTDYADLHFREEEELMRSAGVDARHTDVHRETHRRFLAQVEFMHEEVSKGKAGSLERLSRFLVHWLGYHILGSDKNLARQITAIRAGATPEAAYLQEESSKDERTEPLVKALDSLFHIISERNRDLSELNRTLEAKVEERTAALVAANADLEAMALTDVLTGLPNRRHVIQRLQVLWQESGGDFPLACIMIDADHFKGVNDTYGHDAGDVVLQEVARTLQHNLRTDDVLGRLGGDEFFVVCPHTDEAGALKVAGNLREKVAELRVPTGDGAWHGSISVGVAARQPAHEDYKALVKAADEGVYEAKRAGKNCVRTAGGLSSTA